MPHNGRPSKGCQTCKQRHVKCDETRPACYRCSRTNRVCPGYVEGLDLVLRHQNKFAKAIAEYYRRKAAADEVKNPTQQRNTLSPASTVLYPPLAESKEFYAQTFFVSAYVTHSHDCRSDRGCLEVLAFMLDRLKPGSLLSMALLVVSYSLYAAWDPNIRNGENTETQVAYANAIRALRAALSDPEECVSDETLMAVCILGYYEAIVDTYMSRPPTMQHYSGAAAIIKKRQSITMTSELSKRLLLAARSHLVFKALQTSSFIDQAPELWQDPQEMLHSPAVSLDSLSVEVANVVATARNYSLKLSASSSNDTELASDKRRILLRAQAINARLLSWRKTVPSEWTPLRLSRHQTPTEIVNAGFYGDYCDIYPELPVCRIWNDWRARRLKVLLLIAKFDDGGPATIAILDIYQVIGDIFASVPFALGSKTEASTMYDTQIRYPCFPGQPVSSNHYRSAAAMAGACLHFPLTTALDAMPYLNKEQQIFIIAQLTRLLRCYDVKGMRN